MKYNCIILNFFFVFGCYAMDKEKSPSSDSVQPAKPKMVRFASDVADQKAAFEKALQEQRNDQLRNYKPAQRHAKK